MKKITFWILVFLAFSSAKANDGYKLWLQYYSFENAQQEASYQPYFSKASVNGDSPTITAIKKEIQIAADGFFAEKLKPEFDQNYEDKLGGKNR